MLALFPAAAIVWFSYPTHACPPRLTVPVASDLTQDTLGPSRLPTRAFLVQGGSIALQAGVMRNPDIQPLPIGKFRYPTRYFITVMNETAVPVWVDVEWQFPEEKPKTWKGKRLESGRSFATWRTAFSVMEDQPIHLRFAVYSDEAHTTQIGAEDTFMRFAKSEKEAFLKNFSRSQGLPLISGWPELGAFADSVPGTLADSRLQGDIQLLVWKEESKLHRDCTHEMLGAEATPLDGSALLTTMRRTDSVAAAQLLLRAQDPAAEHPVRLERWRVRSCETITTYEVLFSAAAGGGTDLLVRPMPAVPAPAP
jgi:hypothetical protein